LRLGEEVGADWVVLGRFAVKAESLQAGLQLLDLHGPRLMPWVQRNGPFARLLDAQGVLAWAVLKRVDPAFPLSREEFQRQHPQLQVSAFESYVRGLLAMSEEQQRHYFLQAYIACSPTTARPLTGWRCLTSSNRTTPPPPAGWPKFPAATPCRQRPAFISPCASTSRTMPPAPLQL
jgi:hypothetical protein